MVADVFLYCARPVSHLTSKDVLVGTDYDVFRQAADALRIPVDEVDSALEHLRMRTTLGKKGFRIHFHPAELSAVSVEIHSAIEDVAERREGAMDRLTTGGREVELVRQRLSRTVECVSINLGTGDVDAGWPLGWAVGEFLARVGDALILDDYVYFHVLPDGTVAPLLQLS